jgi:hypothetical protein
VPHHPALGHRLLGVGQRPEDQQRQSHCQNHPADRSRQRSKHCMQLISIYPVFFG